MTTFHSLLVTGVYPPRRGAIGSYTACLGRALQAAGLSVDIVTGTGEPGQEMLEARAQPGTSPSDTAGRAHSIVPGWGPSGVAHVVNFARDRSPAVVNLQYVPYLYGARGIAPAVALLPLLLRRAGIASVVTLHGLAAPRSLQPAGLVLAAIHRVQLSLLLAADASIVTTAHRERVVQRWFPWLGARARCIPVGANTPGKAVSRATRVEFRKHMGLDGNLVLACYGTTHPSKHPSWVLDTLIAARQAGIDARLLAIGQEEQLYLEALASVPPDYGLIRHTVHWTGWVPDGKVSLFLKGADLLLQPFVDGVSTLRGSLMAGLQDGIPVVTTAGRETDHRLFQDSIVALAPHNDRAAFIATALKWCREPPEQRRRLGDAGQALFTRLATWERISAKVAEVHRFALARGGRT
ncbi:MAG: hypothetical protein CL878_05560 [Dehalococcoidia bacterium]|nr:hypothetical protein [Dehalococcoidia bacterium]